MVRIRENNSELQYIQKVDKRLKVARDELNGVNKVREVVMVVLAMLYNGEMGNKTTRSVTLHVRYAQADVYFWRIIRASGSQPMVTYTTCQLFLSYIKWWPIHMKGSAN